MVFSHAFAGAALTKFITSRSKVDYTVKQRNILYFVGIVAAVTPDFDILVLFFDKTLQHRMLISHSLFPYTLLTILVYVLAKSKGREFLKKLALVFFFGALSHIILDALAGGLVLLAPFSYQLIGFPLNFPSNPAKWAQAYVSSKYMLAEGAIFLSYLLAIKEDKNQVLRALPIFFFIVATLMFLIVIYSLL